MIINSTRTRYSFLFAATTCLTLCTLSTSSADSNDSDSQGLPELGSSTASNSDFGDSTATVNSIERAEGGTYTSATWTIANSGGNSISITDFRNTVFPYGAEGLTPANGVALVDPDTEVRYYPSKDSENECLCSGPRAPQDYLKSLKDGDEGTYWSAYDVPEEVTSVDVEIPGFKPITGVPIE